MGTVKSTAQVVSLIFVFLSLLPAASRAEDGKVMEPSTGVQFEAELDGLSLIGVGVRSILVFDVYAAGLYVDAAGMDEYLKASKKKNLYNAVVYGGFKKRMILHFVRSADADKIRGAFREALEANMTREELDQEKDNIERFLAACEGGVKDGQRFEFVATGRKVKILQAGDAIFETDSVTLTRGMWKGWFGSEPVQEDLKAALVSRCAEVLKEWAGKPE